MALFVLGDPHLSLGASKPMDIFPGWNDYVERLEKNWRKLTAVWKKMRWRRHTKRSMMITTKSW